VAYGKHSTRMLAGAALAMTATLAAAGCTSSPAASTGTGTSGTSAGPTVTAAQARQVFGSYIAVADRAAASDDTSLALSRVTGVQKATITAQLKAAKTGAGGLARYRYGTPTFYLTQPDGYPLWFVASVQRTLVGRPGTPGGPAGTAGVPLAASGRVLMVFEQGSKDGTWLVASTSQLPPGGSVPPLATNSAGYVATVPLTSGAQLAQPEIAGPLQAAVVDDGPASPAAKVVAAGPLTTGIYAAARSPATGLTAPPGDIYQWELEGSGYHRWALRTADGGALVFYGMYLDSTVEVPSLLNKGYPINPGPPITVPGYLSFLLTPGQHVARTRLEDEQVLSFAAVDPPAGAGGIGTEKITVIAIGGGLTYAGAS
jgi:hypothetical protein